MSDRLEELRHELADIEASLAEQEGSAEESQVDQGLIGKAERIEAEILQLERVAREEAGAQPVEVLDSAGVPLDVVGAPHEFRNPAEDLVIPSAPPGSQELVHATNVVLDKHDEDQVLSILEERFDPVLMYDFDRSGKRVQGLSVKGVFEGVRLLNATGHARIQAMPSTVTFGSETRDVGNGDEEFVVCTIAAADEVSGLVVLGTAMEPVLMRLRNGKTKFDVFCRAKALSKAQRNALAGHIPERLKQAMLAMFRGQPQRVLEVKHGAGAAATAQLPPPVDSPAAKALEEECRSLWAEIRGLPGWRELMMPGVYNAKLSRARSSEAELEAFRDSLVSLRDKLAGEATR